MTIDLRSDTMALPVEAMKAAMFNAKVGDAVFDEDPTVRELETKAAKMFDMDDAIFCPSGTMTNQVAINVHTRPGDEVICHKHAHIYYYEGGGLAKNSHISACLLDGERGMFTADAVKQHINPDDIHRPRTSLVEIENTMNKGGGSIWSFDELVKIGKICRENKLKYHLDGARLFNALVETGEKPEDFGKLFDSISVCLSKGLGAPVGSLLIGNSDFIHEAKRVRKVMGGGMRQAGYLAAAGIYALDNHIERLKDDHRRAKLIADTLNNLPYIEKVYKPETNILIFKLKDKISTEKFVKILNENRILALPFGIQLIRFVTHIDFTDMMLEKLVEALKTRIVRD